MKNIMRVIGLAVLPILLGSSLAYSAQCAAITKKGTQCKRQAPAGEVFCWQHAGKVSQVNAEKKPARVPAAKSRSATKAVDLETTRCQAITKKGTQCKRQSEPGSVFCWQHKGESPEKAEERKTANEPVKIKVSAEQKTLEKAAGRCQALTKKGTQCKRSAKPGDRFCWQHGK